MKEVNPSGAVGLVKVPLQVPAFAPLPGSADL